MRKFPSREVSSRRRRAAPACLAVLSLAACTVSPPSGPTVMAAPGKNKSFGQFSVDDGRCRQYAGGANGGVTPQQGGASSGVGTAAAGTVLGAAAGALLGAAGGDAGVGAAFGAGSGLLLGSVAGTGNAAESQASLQSNYDRVYAQCMVASGEDVTPPPVLASSYPAAPPVVVVSPPPVYYYGYGYRPGWRAGWGWGW